MDDEVLNIKQAAAFLKCSEYQLRKQAQRKEVPCTKEGKWKFSKQLLIEYFQNKCKQQCSTKEKTNTATPSATITPNLRCTQNQYTEALEQKTNH